MSIKLFYTQPGCADTSEAKFTSFTRMDRSLLLFYKIKDEGDMQESGVYWNHHNSIPLALLAQRMSLGAKRSNLQPLQIASLLSLLAMTSFLGDSILKFTMILKSFQAEYQSADIKDESGFESIGINGATAGFYENHFAQNMFGCDRIIAGRSGISAKNK